MSSCMLLRNTVESFVSFSYLLGYEIQKHKNELQELVIEAKKGENKIRLLISYFDNQFQSIDLYVNTYFASSFIHKNHYKILQEAINSL